MFRWFRPLSAPDEIYASSLQTLHLGHALWYPEPHESGEPQIGDVGFIHEGAFIRLFNLDLSAPEKKVTFWEPPYEITEPLPPGVLKIDRRHRPLVPDHYCSHGVESKELHASANITAGANVSAALTANYTCKAAQGAILALKSEAHAETVFENAVLENYIARHHDGWYAYAKDVLGHRFKQESLIVVRGWVKTEADWAVAAFSNASTSVSASVEGNAGGVAGAGIGGSHSRSVTGPRVQRQGRDYLADASRPRPAEPIRDQCVLVKRYMLRKRLVILKKIVAGADYHRLPGAGDERGGSGGKGVVVQEEEDLIDANMLEFKGEGEAPDLLEILLDYMLEVCPPKPSDVCSAK
ncbi:uncharacterized protein PHACADRAFT_88495 [Phanerochaete carnosa HHB-10118-sp]|uniref:Uncharacterized protein n=1 Tax=Phanerochaete carnosa (strain HHB-10118-sp) TaxID=650164 RepID=K5V7S7_PHACS|nr:uncharacterized protein PHACADRAFT_88495 [Phanerochaete carnosa HHB-10118-sp]EKM58791.1 hypothetical protein PHACADRAFT_88495 [Phanerochaete carnosa HHB-10118-sp]